MPRFFVLILLLLSLALCGGSTCHFSTSSKKKDPDRKGSGVSVVVDTRVNGSTGGSAAGAPAAAVPEPDGVLLFATGGALLAWRLRRKRGTQRGSDT